MENLLLSYCHYSYQHQLVCLCFAKLLLPLSEHVGDLVVRNCRGGEKQV